MALLTAPPEAARLVASDVNLWSCSSEKCDLKRVVRGGGRRAAAQGWGRRGMQGTNSWDSVRGDRHEQDCRDIPALHMPHSSTISFCSVESKYTIHHALASW